MVNTCNQSAHFLLLKMTDFIDNLLTNMSTKFNEQKEVGPINLKEDKTLKWRGLHNNQYAAVKKRKDARKSVASTSDTPENTLVTGENSSSVSTADKIGAKEVQDDSAIDETGNAEENKSIRRTTRRKLNEEVAENIGRLRGRQRKRQTSPEAATSEPVVPEKIERPNDDVSSVAAGRARRTRVRKSTNSADQPGPSEVTITPLDRSKSPNVKPEEVSTVEVDTVESQTHHGQPRLRRSERTLYGTAASEGKERASSIETKTEEIVKTAVASNDPGASDSLKKYRKKGSEGLDKKQGAADDGKAIQSETIDVQNKAQTSSHEDIKTESDQPIAEDIIAKVEGDSGGSGVPSASPPDQTTEFEAEPKTEEVADNDIEIVGPSAANTPKKRGRKPGTKILPKIEKKSELPIATRSSRVKKSPRRDETAFLYNLSKKDKTLNEHVSCRSWLFDRFHLANKII